MKRFLLILAIATVSATAASAQYINDSDNSDETMVISDGMKYRDLKQIYSYKDYVPSVFDRYNTAGMGVASFFIPGLGQMLSHEVGRGFAWLGGNAAAYLMFGLGSSMIESGEYYNNDQMARNGLILGWVGLLSWITIDICATVDAVRVAKVKNMYENDLRKIYSLDFQLHPSVNYIQKGNSLQPTAGLTLALNF